MRSTIVKAFSLLSLMAVSLPVMATMIAPNQQVYPTMDPRFIQRGNQDITYTIPRNYRGNTNWQTRGAWNNNGTISGPYFGEENNTLWGTLGGAVIGNGLGYLLGGNRTAWTLGGTALGFLWGKNKDRSDDFQYYYHPQTTRMNRSIYSGEEGKSFSLSSNSYADAYSRSESHVIID